MYIKSFKLSNIKCFSDLELDFYTNGTPRLWTTILGENGSGKSTLLQAIAATLAGPAAMRELLPVAEGWVRKDAQYGELEAELMWTEGDALTPWWPKKKTPYIAKYIVTGKNTGDLPREYREYNALEIAAWSGEAQGKDREAISKDMNRLKQTAYAEGKLGWFTCGYGPFRRLSGGAQKADQILYGGRKAARFVTLFREDAALTNATEWLISLHNTAREGNTNSARALEQIKATFRNELLPESVELIVTANSALLQVSSQKAVPFQDLSDGYRSMLALGIDLLRWMTVAFPDSDDIQSNHGVVLIDELDAHAHPAWQRQIGHWLHGKFPNVQFIVASHSPFLAQVSDTPGGNIILEQGTRGVQTRDEVDIVNTWRADQILTDLFDLPTTRSPEVERKIERLTALRQKTRRGKLTEAEIDEYRQLELWTEDLPPAIEDPVTRERAGLLSAAVDARQSELREIE